MESLGGSFGGPAAETDSDRRMRWTAGLGRAAPELLPLNMEIEERLEMDRRRARGAVWYESRLSSVSELAVVKEGMLASGGGEVDRRFG